MKRLITTIIALVAFLAFAFFHEQKIATQAAKTPTVGILQLMTHPALDSIHKGIIAGLKENGYVVGKNLKIDYQNAQGDQSNLKSMSDRFANEKVNMMVGIATPSAQSLAHVTTKTPIVMGAISDPVGSGLVKSLTNPSNNGNITGTQHIEPVAQQVKLIKKLMPNLKTIGGIYTSSDDSSTAEFKEFKQLAQKAGIEVKTYTITSTNDIDQVAATMAHEVQAVYVPTDNTVASGIQALLKNTNAAKIPVFASVATMVKSGAVATYSVSQYDIGRLTGKLVAQILKGKKPNQMPIQHVTQGDYAFNLSQAQRFGINIPQDLIKQAEKKGVIYKWH